MSCCKHEYESDEYQVWPKVIVDMQARNEQGYEKYNRYLRTDCPDDMLQHAYEEALDLAVYLKTLLLRAKNKLPDDIIRLRAESFMEAAKYGD